MPREVECPQLIESWVGHKLILAATIPLYFLCGASLLELLQSWTNVTQSLRR